MEKRKRKQRPVEDDGITTTPVDTRMEKRKRKRPVEDDDITTPVDTRMEKRKRKRQAEDDDITTPVDTRMEKRKGKRPVEDDDITTPVGTRTEVTDADGDPKKATGIEAPLSHSGEGRADSGPPVAQSEGATTSAISHRVEKMANYTPHTSLELRTGRYRNLKTLAVHERINEPYFGIWWVVPKTHYLLQKRPIPEKYQLKGVRGRELKLHFMTLQNPTPGNTSAKPSIFNPLKTAYLMRFLRTEYPCLNCPSRNVKYIGRSYRLHLASQNVLDQASALELMASCHDRLQMATLLLHMRDEAPSFAVRKNCFFKAHPDLPETFQMKIEDLWALAKELLGNTFHPRLVVKKPKNKKDYHFHEIALFVNEHMQPAANKVRYNCRKGQIVSF